MIFYSGTLNHEEKSNKHITTGVDPNELTKPVKQSKLNLMNKSSDQNLNADLKI
jgi:hypothetical protein